MRDDKWGFVDTSGKEVIPPIYDEVQNFKGGFAEAKKDGKWTKLCRPQGVLTNPAFAWDIQI